MLGQLGLELRIAVGGDPSCCNSGCSPGHTGLEQSWRSRRGNLFQSRPSNAKERVGVSGKLAPKVVYALDKATMASTSVRSHLL